MATWSAPRIEYLGQWHYETLVQLHAILLRFRDEHRGELRAFAADFGSDHVAGLEEVTALSEAENEIAEIEAALQRLR